VEILRGRYVQDDPERKAAVETERVNAEIARLIYTMRTEEGLTQGQLAELVGTTQSVISRLEDSDYEGHSLSMLNRIADALQRKLTVVMTAKDPYAERVLGGAGRPSHKQSVMLHRIAEALQKELIVVMTAKDRHEQRVLGGAWRPIRNQSATHDKNICRRLAAGSRRAAIEWAR